MTAALSRDGGRMENGKKQQGNEAAVLMYIHLVYYTGDRSLVESILNNGAAGIVADRILFLDAVDNDGDALRFQHNNGSHFDVIFVHEEYARRVYGMILDAIRNGRKLLEMDIREQQTANVPAPEEKG